MKIIIIRHGNTDANKLGMLQGHGDHSLNKLGVKQAMIASKNIKNTHIDNFYSSDLHRAKQTSSIISNLISYQGIVVFSSKLRERDIGLLEDKKEISLKINNGDKMSFCPKGGESLLDVFNRISKFYSLIKKENKNKTVLIVSHRDLISMLLIYIKKMEVNYSNYKEMLVDNGSVTTLFDDYHANVPID